MDLNKINVDEIDLNLERDEENLTRSILRFPEIVEKTANERRPNILANYLYQLSSFSKFYKYCPVLPSEEKVKCRRLLLVDATRQVLNNGLNLLGIEAPERM